MHFMIRHLLVALVLVIAIECPAAEGDRPNILFAFADDWGRYASIYAAVDGQGTISDVVRTPNFDQLARRGVLFRNAFVNSPSCTPCRSALLSGQYFWRTGRGAILQGGKWDSSIPTFPLLLKDNGYFIGKSFKVWSPGVPVDAPYGGQQFAFEQGGRRFNQFSENATQLVANGKSIDEAKRELLEEVRTNFAKFLLRRDRVQPFCYWFGPTNVHRTWVKGSGKALWSFDPDSLKGKLPPFLPDVPEVREDLTDYFGEIAAFDAALGVLVEELEKSGELDRTLIVVSGDHGAPGFPHGKCNLYDFGVRVSLAIAGPNVHGNRVVDDFVNLMDLAPTFLEAGAADVPDVMTGKSLWPVLRSDRSGLVDESRTWVVVGRERHVAAARSGHEPYPQRSIRTAQFSYIVNFHPERFPLGDPYLLDTDAEPSADELTRNTFITLADDDAGPTKAWLVSHRREAAWAKFFEHTYGKRPREELYDLMKDPHQMHNVATDPAYSTKRAQLKQQLFTLLQSTNDPRLINDGQFFESPPLAGPVPEDAK